MPTSPSKTKAPPRPAAPPAFIPPDPVELFAKLCIENPRATPPSVYDGVTRVGNFTGLVLMRAGQYQVQLWILEPGAEAPEHSHPSIDQILVYVTGEIDFTLNGKPVLEEAAEKVEGDMCSLNGRWHRVKPGKKHSARAGLAGGAFIAYQHWEDGTDPQSAHLDWEGDPMDETHRLALEAA